MTSLRDEIAEIIQTTDEPWLAADDIMTAVREALLRDEFEGPVHRAMSTWVSLDHIYRLREEGEPTHEAAMRNATSAIRSAFDAVTGEGDR